MQFLKTFDSFSIEAYKIFSHPQLKPWILRSTHFVKSAIVNTSQKILSIKNSLHNLCMSKYIKMN